MEERDESLETIKVSRHEKTRRIKLLTVIFLVEGMVRGLNRQKWPQKFEKKFQDEGGGLIWQLWDA